MSDINPSMLGEQFDADFEAKIAAATSAEEIKTLMKDRAVATLPITRDIFDPQILILDDVAIGRASSPVRQIPLTKTITINGMEHIISGEGDLGLAKAETELFRRMFGHAAVEQPRDDSGRFTVREVKKDPAALAELELRWKRGDISSDVYLAESGALDKALQARGVDIAALQKVSNPYESEWKSATDAFIANHPEWSGQWASNTNLAIMSDILQQTRGEDTPDKMAALESAYNFAVANNLLHENPAFTGAKHREATLSAIEAAKTTAKQNAEDAEREKAIKAANTPIELLAALGRTSGVWAIGKGEIMSKQPEPKKPSFDHLGGKSHHIAPAIKGKNPVNFSSAGGKQVHASLLWSEEELAGVEAESTSEFETEADDSEESDGA